MAESREDRRRDPESSGEVSVPIELEIGSGSGSDSKEVNSKEVGNVGSLDNGDSSFPGLAYSSFFWFVENNTRNSVQIMFHVSC